MEILLQHLEVSKLEYEYSEYRHITMSVNNAWKMLNKYYNLTDISPVYVTTVVLNLQLKWSFFKQCWRTRLTWIAEARRTVKQLWITSYRDQILTLNSSTANTANTGEEMDILEQFLITPDSRSQQPIDEYEEYCCLKPDIRITNIIQW